MLMRRRLACLACAAALLTGCTTVGPDFETPKEPAAAGYAMAGDEPTREAALGQKLEGDWWTLFRSPEIDQTVRQAIAGNRSLEAARASLAEARDAVQAQAAQLTLDANASVAKDRVNLNSFGFGQLPLPGGGTLTLNNPTFTIYQFGASGRYDFDLFGQRRRESERLLANAEAQAYQTDAAYLTLTAQVVSQAIDIASLRGQIAAAEDIVKSDQDNLELVSKAFDLGGGTRLDVATVQTELANDEATITPLRQQLTTARHALALLVGQPPSGFTAPDFDLDAIAQPQQVPVQLPSELVRERPDIRAAEAQLHAATARIGVATADLYPKLTLTGSITQGALHPSDLFSYGSTGFLVGPELTVPLFHGTELRAKKRMAEDAARQSYASYQQTVLGAFRQVADSLQAIAHDDQAILDATRQHDASSDSLRLQRLRFQDGKTGLLPVLDAQRSWARARQALIRAHAQRLQDCAALLYAVSHNWDRAATTDPGPAQVASTNPAKPGH
jgi:NodT family efflux transporter outer membrane factor (OMF) lipoprotein